MTVSFTVFGETAPQGSKIRNRYGGMRESSKRLQPWRDQVAQEAGQVMSATGWDDLLAGPLRVELTFYLKRPKRHYGTGRNARLLKPGADIYVTTTPDVGHPRSVLRSRRRRLCHPVPHPRLRERRAPRDRRERMAALAVRLRRVHGFASVDAIQGTPAVGSTLTAGNGSPVCDPACTPSWQWLRCPSASPATWDRPPGGGDDDTRHCPGAVIVQSRSAQNTYLVRPADGNHYIQAEIFLRACDFTGPGLPCRDVDGHGYTATVGPVPPLIFDPPNPPPPPVFTPTAPETRARMINNAILWEQGVGGPQPSARITAAKQILQMTDAQWNQARKVVRPAIDEATDD